MNFDLISVIQLFSSFAATAQLVVVVIAQSVGLTHCIRPSIEIMSRSFSCHYFRLTATSPICLHAALLSYLFIWYVRPDETVTPQVATFCSLTPTHLLISRQLYIL